jgi:hypothetical protein
MGTIDVSTAQCADLEKLANVFGVCVKWSYAGRSSGWVGETDDELRRRAVKEIRRED